MPYIAMELTRSVLHLAILACVAQISCSQHWSYGWLPGGKRSVDELEATLEMIDSRNHMTVAEEPSPQYVLDKLSPFDSLNAEAGEFSKKRKWLLHKRK